MNDKEYIQISELVFKSIEGEISDEEFSILDRKIATDPEIARYYRQIVSIYTAMDFQGSEVQFSRQSLGVQHNDLLLQLLGEEERVAPTIEIPQEHPQRELIQKVAYEKSVRKISKFSVASVIISIAAMLFLVIFFKFQPVPTVQQIAVLTDSINAQWADSPKAYKTGDLVYTETRIELVGGSVEFTVDNGVKLTIEGPVRFTFEDAMNVSLDQGKLIANVPLNAAGFTVKTPSATVVDLGTEFGAMVDTEGSTQVAVFKGKVFLLSGRSGATTSSQILEVNQARCVDFKTSRVEEIDKYKSVFANRMLSLYENTLRETNPTAYWKLGDFNNQVISNVFGGHHYPGRLGEAVSKVPLNIRTDGNDVLHAIGFRGTQDSYVDFGSILDPQQDSYTVSIWFKADSVDSPESKGQFLVAKHSVKQYGWRVIVYKDNLQVRVSAFSDEGEMLQVNKNCKNCLVPGRFHHLVMVIDRQSQTVIPYLDGESQGWEFTKKGESGLFNTQSLNKDHGLTHRLGNDMSIFSDGSLSIGRRSYEDNLFGRSPFKGCVYDVGIWRRALNGEEIKNLYNYCPLKDFKQP